MKCLMVSVLYNAAYRKCALGGPSETQENLFLVNEEGPCEPADTSSVLVLDKIMDRWIVARPFADRYKKKMMFGGNFIYSSDARFPHDYPIPVHDRNEGSKWPE